mgnify:CR=1 FL=1
MNTKFRAVTNKDSMMADSSSKNSFDYSGVFLTLDNVLLPEEKLSPTPSMKDGLDAETEQDLRILGCEFIQTAGILLKLPQVSQLKKLKNCNCNPV